MSENTSHDKIASDEHSRILASCYRFILSWPDPPLIKNEPAADHLREDEAAGSDDEYPSIQPDLSARDEAQEQGEGGISL